MSEQKATVKLVTVKIKTAATCAEVRDAVAQTLDVGTTPQGFLPPDATITRKVRVQDVGSR